jgi:LysR family hydrogen peroxide-inducible transcriptional activator
MQTLPSMKQLQYLLALQDHGSFSEAAAACNVTQSTLSGGIATLEDLLRQKLADRSQRRITLTPLGLEIAEKARGIVGSAGDLVARARSLDEPLTGPLRLGIIPTIAPYLLPRILPGLQSRFPKLELQLHEDLSQRLVEQARAGRLDVILLAFPFETPGMDQLTLFEEKFVLARLRGSRRTRKALSIGDLEGETLLLLDEGHCLRDHALAACKLTAPRERRTFSATSLPTLIQMVGHGYGVTLLPEMAADSTLSDKIEIVPFSNPAPTRRIGLAWRQGQAHHADFKLLGRACTAILKEK